METKNMWLDSYGRRVDFLMTEIERYRLSGSYGGNLDLTEILTIFKGTKTEIIRLQRVIDTMKDTVSEELVRLKEELKTKDTQIEALNKQTESFFQTSDAVVDGE